MQLIKSRGNIKLRVQFQQRPMSYTTLCTQGNIQKTQIVRIVVSYRSISAKPTHFPRLTWLFFYFFYFVLIDVQLRRRHRIALINSNTQWKVIVCSIGRNTGIVDRRVSMLRREEAEIDVNSRCPTLRQKFVFRNGRAGSCWRRT